MARYGGAEQRAALLNSVRETGGVNEAKGVVHAFREMKGLGYSLEDVSLHYRGNQGLDLNFKMTDSAIERIGFVTYLLDLDRSVFDLAGFESDRLIDAVLSNSFPR